MALWRPFSERSEGGVHLNPVCLVKNVKRENVEKVKGTVCYGTERYNNQITTVHVLLEMDSSADLLFWMVAWFKSTVFQIPDPGLAGLADTCASVVSSIHKRSHVHTTEVRTIPAVFTVGLYRFKDKELYLLSPTTRLPPSSPTAMPLSYEALADVP